MPVLVAMIEDDAPFADAMRHFFSLSHDVECVAVFPNAEAALGGLAVMEPSPDVLLVDIHLPKMGGIEFVARLKARTPNTLCLMLTMYEESSVIFDALKAGASGYLLKRTPPQEVVASILQAQFGGAPMSPEVALRVVNYFHQPAPAPASEVSTLAAREREVLYLLSKGYLYKEIGEQLEISTHTVNSHIRRIYEKLHVQSRSQAVAKYRGLK
ncbi:MAG: response regulator transcription factor [Verrucomicrobiota bacterium]